MKPNRKVKLLHNFSAVFIGLSSLLLPALSYGVCENITPSTPDSRLTDNGDFTVSDHATGLMWKQCSEGQNNNSTCRGSVSTHTWQAALQVAPTLNTTGGFAGFTDWRLPNIKELRSIVEVACHTPAINNNRFPNSDSGNYWSATASVSNINNAWRIEFEEGSTSDSRDSRSNSYAVRLVRTLQ